MRRVDPTVRFWSKVAKGEGCWEWQGAKRRGYGAFGIAAGHGVQSHRFAYELTYGPIPPDLFVCHSCDNPGCVRPDHLWLGTVLENTRDAKAKGRLRSGDNHGAHLHPETRPRGEQHGISKLTEEQVRAIRAGYLLGVTSHGSLAAKFGVSAETVRKVIIRRTWRHVA